MPRKGEVPKRKPLPDPKFTDQPVDMRRKVTKFALMPGTQVDGQVAPGAVSAIALPSRAAYFASTQVLDPASLTATFEKKRRNGLPSAVPR